MSRRFVLALVALLAVAGLVAPAGAVSSRATAAPANGRCYNLTFSQTYPVSSNVGSVPCTSKHTTKTFLVKNVPNNVDYKHITDAAFAKLAITMCLPQFRATLGTTVPNQHLTAYDFIFFAPTSTQKAAGARWVRCDVTLLGNNTLRALPTNTTPFIQGAITDTTRRCLATSHHWVTTCAGVHSYRSTSAHTLTTGTHYRTTEQFLANGRKYCPTADYYTWPNKFAWSVGDHVLICFDRTAS